MFIKNFIVSTCTCEVVTQVQLVWQFEDSNSFGISYHVTGSETERSCPFWSGQHSFRQPWLTSLQHQSPCLWVYRSDMVTHSTTMESLASPLLRPDNLHVTIYLCNVINVPVRVATWSPPRVHYRSLIVHNLYQWPSTENKFIIRTNIICWWH
jgi:hypothetical protein